MVLGLLKNIPILNSFLGKPAASQESSGTEAAAKANEKAIAQEGLKPLFIVALPEGDFSELKAKLKEKFNGRDLHFEVDPELKKPKLYILKPNALAKRNLEIALDKAFIKDNYKSIELSGDANKLGESLLRTMNTEFITLEGAERKIEYTQKEAEKAKLRQSLESLSKMKAELASPAERLKAVGVNSCANGTCGHDHGKQLSNQLGQPSLVAIRENQDESQKREPVTDLKSLGKLIRKINIEGKQNWSNYRASVAQLGEALQVIKPRGDAEHRELEQKKELHGRFQREISVIQSMDSIEALEILKKQDNSSAPSPWFMQNFIAKYINNKIETAQSEDLSNLSSDTLAKLEKSDPISQEINRKLVKPLQVAGALDATDMQKAAQDKEKAAQKEKGKGNHTKASRL
jgi:hypothetical protein